jgi:hypothetical protein
MLENSLKTLLGKTFIISHFVIILLVISLRLAGKFDDSTIKAALATLAPLLATYTTPLMMDIIRRRHKNMPGKSVTSNFTMLVLGMPGLFILFIISIIIKQAIMPDSVENFTVYLSMGEFIFGVYLATIFRILFPPHFPPAA